VLEISPFNPPTSWCPFRRFAMPASLPDLHPKASRKTPALAPQAHAAHHFPRCLTTLAEYREKATGLPSIPDLQAMACLNGPNISSCRCGAPGLKDQGRCSTPTRLLRPFYDQWPGKQAPTVERRYPWNRKQSPLSVGYWGSNCLLSPNTACKCGRWETPALMYAKSSIGIGADSA
jgi:hypothetical protein